jgi:acyl-homoserine lactone acylase PvdQ
MKHWALVAGLLSVTAGSGFGQAKRPGSGVTIYRDTWGIAHVFGPTDASVAYGFGYAQAEDNFPRIEENYVRAIGRAAELRGERELNGDWLNRALEIPRLARGEYARLDARMRGIVDGFAAGINRYLETHRDVRPRLLRRIEPWYPLAFIRYNYYQNGFVYSAGLRSDELRVAGASAEERRSEGSNGWVIGPSRTAAGHPLLFINPHLPWFGPGQVYEGHLHSAEGWNFTGYARFGFPFPYVGHNESLGWVSTDNAADLADLYREQFPDSLTPRYRSGGGTRIARRWADSIAVRSGDRVAWRRFTFLATHHGPIVARRDGQPLALRMARLEADGWLREWYDMTKARSVHELKRAMTPLAMNFGNVMAADREGNTWYLYNGSVPRRSPRFDWQAPVDGADPETEWQGFLAIDELPQLLNPPSGWMQNCNTSPYLLTDRGNPDSLAVPRYVVTEGDNPRGRISRAILAADRAWTFDALVRTAFDLRVDAAGAVRALAPGDRPADQDAGAGWRAALDSLRGWNGTSDARSIATTLFVWWRNEAERREAAPDVAAFIAAVEDLTKRFGTWQVPWGEVSRMQRLDERSDSASFRDERPSLPLPAMSGRDGSVFTAYAAPVAGQRRLYGVAGGTYVSVVEFGPTVRAMTVHPFGVSGDPASPHFFDQGALFSRGELRPAWFTLDEIKAHLESAYEPASAGPHRSR